ncbi:hypothetical protein GOC14_06775 [Sinorhizobium meliloti]|nr:hypothetical protein [Sinorhizobium meliloti]
MDARPWWWSAALLLMIAILMGSHLAMLWVGVRECDQYAAILLDKAARGDQINVDDRTVPKCAAVEENFTDAANLYLAVILSLLSGAGFSAGMAASRERPSEKKNDRNDL